jgi:hypothetical protein
MGASVPDQAGRAAHRAAEASRPSGDHPSRIEEKLTAQQRRDLIASNERIWWSADGRVSNAMHRKGLIEAPTWSGSALLTPLGREVRKRAIAIETRQGGNEVPSRSDESAGRKASPNPGHDRRRG